MAAAATAQMMPSLNSERGIWMQPSSDEDEEERGAEEVLLLPPSPLDRRRPRLMHRFLTLLEEYSACITVPALCAFAVYALTVDWYSTQTFLVSTNSSLLLVPSPWVVNSLKIQVIGGQTGPALYGFTSIPVLGSKAAWDEVHNMTVASNEIGAFAMWLNKGSSLNFTCLIKEPSGSSKVLFRILEEDISTASWIEDSNQDSQWQCSEDSGAVLRFKAARDGNYSFLVENYEDQSVKVHVALQVLATFYNTGSAVYLCIPFPEGCELQVSLFGNRAAVLTTPTDYQKKSWEARLSYQIRWLTIVTALGCFVMFVSMTYKMMSRLQFQFSRQIQEDESRPHEDDWGDSDDNDENAKEFEGSSSAVCAVCVDADKDSFFLPCGHSITCLACGLRLKGDEVCPICKEAITEVKQIVCV